MSSASEGKECSSTDSLTRRSPILCLLSCLLSVYFFTGQEAVKGCTFKTHTVGFMRIDGRYT